MNLMMLNVGYATHHADWNWQKVSSPFIRIFYIMEGEAMLHLPDKDVRLKPGYMYIIPAFVIHSYECHGVFKLYYIHMYEGFKNEVDMQETFELPTEVWAGNSVKRLFEYVSTQHPDAKLPGPDPKSYDTSAQTSDYVERYMNMALWEKMELRGAMLLPSTGLSRNMLEIVFMNCLGVSLSQLSTLNSQLCFGGLPPKR